MAQLLQQGLQVCACKEGLPTVWNGSIMATIPSGKNKTRGVVLNDHVGKILGRWIRPMAVQMEPLLVARSQAVGSARPGS